MFACFAALGLVPVLSLRLLLSLQYRHEVERRGLAQGRAQAEAVGRLVAETELEGHDLGSGLSTAEEQRLTALSRAEVAGGHAVRLRLRAPDERVVFADDTSSLLAAPEDEVTEALRGETVALITRLNSDPNDVGPPGERVVEVYAPLISPQTKTVIGALEIYLPYDPIAAELTAGLHRLYLALAGGLTLLYLLLAGIAAWLTRRLSRNAAEYEHLALHDALTGLPNRTLFRDRVQTAVALGGRAGTGAAVVMVDLDRFKEVNDTLGHHNGDQLLVRLAERLSGTVRGVDTVARLGGDEFGIVLLGASSREATDSTLARVQAAIEQEVDLAGLPLSVEASMGVAYAPTDGSDPDVLIQRADVAMYVAKRSHAGVVHYDPRHDDYNAERLALVAELRRAIDRNELVLHYQPKASLPGMGVHAVEALVRWQHPERGLLPPDVFLPIAEQTGLIDPLTGWVLDAALAQLGRWRTVAPALVVAVNISARSLQRHDFPDRVLEALGRADLPPQRLLLEITETALVTDAERAADVLRRLDTAGLRLSLDDFGQGYTSLGQLRHLPLSELKIDKLFVMNMLTNPSDAAIVRSVIELGHNLGLDVVAEGVEDEAVLQTLVTLGCDVAQGYFLAKPFPAERLESWLEEHESHQTGRGKAEPLLSRTSCLAHAALAARSVASGAVLPAEPDARSGQG